jgi:hypothetical protein
MSMVEIHWPQPFFAFSNECVTQRSRLQVLLHFTDNTYNFGVFCFGLANCYSRMVCSDVSIYSLVDTSRCAHNEHHPHPHLFCPNGRNQTLTQFLIFERFSRGHMLAFLLVWILGLWNDWRSASLIVGLENNIACHRKGTTV